MAAAIHLDEREFVIHAADLEHLDRAIALLKKDHSYTAAERLAHLRGMVKAHLADGEA